MVKIKLTLLFFILTSILQAQTTDIPLVSVDIKDATFEQFAHLLERESNLTIIYKPDWVKDTRVTLKVNEESVIQLLKWALDNDELNIVRWNDFIVILQKEDLIDQLPDYNKKPLAEKEETDDEASDNSEFMVGRKVDFLKIKVGEPKYQMAGKNILVKGKIIDATSGNPIESSTLYIVPLKRGAISDQQGNLEINLPPGKYAARVECLGMKKIDCQLEVISDGSFELKMERQKFDIQEVEIYGDRQMSIREKDPGLEKLNVKTIKELPTMMGETDIIKISEMLPGVVSIGEGSTGLIVRGGSFDQNAFYFNNVTVYNTAHMFGFFPAFNTDVISDFSLYKGYIPAKYGGRLSSVFNINARTGNKKHYTAHGGISPVAANLTVEGPIKRDTASFFINGRASYSDWILKQIDDYNIRNSEASFYDLTASFDYDLANTQVNVFGYYSQDYFKFSDINTYWYSNSGVSATVGHIFSPLLQSDFSLSGSLYKFKTVDEQLENAEYEHEFSVAQYDFKAGFHQAIGNKHHFNYGADITWYQLKRGKVLPFGDDSNKKPIDLGNEQGLENALFFSDNIEVTPLFNVSAGFRFSFYSPFGSKKVYTYDDDSPKEIRTINDSIFFDKGKPIKWYYFPELRISLNYQTDENGTVKLAFTQMHQNIFMLNKTITLAPNSPWKLADYHLEPSRAYQFSLGVFRTTTKRDWEYSVEVFYKNARNYTEFKDGADFLGSPLVETTVLQGDLKSYGIEVLLKKYWPKINIWLAYTYSRSLVKVDGPNSWDKINNGNQYPSNFDIPHVLNFMFLYHISKRVTFGTTITYQSGKPGTFPTSYYYIDGVAHLDYSDRNKYRIPDYFRTDISLTIEGNLRKDKFLHSRFNFSVYNLTARDNPYSVFFEQDSGRIVGFQYSVISVPVFMATWIFKLGNYDAN